MLESREDRWNCIRYLGVGNEEFVPNQTVASDHGWAR
jgi:hypothetical protein